MKRLIMCLLVLTTLNSHAGTLVSKDTGESMEFTVSQVDRVIMVNSNTAGIPQRIKIDDVVNRPVHANYFSVSRGWLNGNFEGEYEMAYLFPIFTPITLGAHVIDILIAPAQGLDALIKNSSLRKDFKVLSQAINNSKTYKINHKGYSRIADLLRVIKDTTPTNAEVIKLEIGQSVLEDSEEESFQVVKAIAGGLIYLSDNRWYEPKNVHPLKNELNNIRVGDCVVENYHAPSFQTVKAIAKGNFYLSDDLVYLSKNVSHVECGLE